MLAIHGSVVSIQLRYLEMTKWLCGCSSGLLFEAYDAVFLLSVDCDCSAEEVRWSHVWAVWKVAFEGGPKQWRTEGGGWGFKPPRNSEVLTQLSQIPSSVATYSEYGFHSFANWVEPLTRGLPPLDPRSVCPLSSTEFVESPPTKKITGVTPRPPKIPGYATGPNFIIVGQKMKLGCTRLGIFEDRWVTECWKRFPVSWGRGENAVLFFLMLQPCVKLTFTTRIMHVAENLPCVQLQLQYRFCGSEHFSY
jgi:hypothetical protein